VSWSEHYLEDTSEYADRRIPDWMECVTVNIFR